jgi:hypothetical protein
MSESLMQKRIELEGKKKRLLEELQQTEREMAQNFEEIMGQATKVFFTNVETMVDKEITPAYSALRKAVGAKDHLALLDACKKLVGLAINIQENWAEVAGNIDRSMTNGRSDEVQDS